MKIPPKLISCLLLANVIGLCFVEFAAAQERQASADRPPLPAGPLLRPWGPKEAWTISFEYKGAAPPSGTENSGGAGKQVFNESTPPKMVSITRFEPFFTMRYVGRNPSDSFRYFVLEDSYFFQSPPQNTTTRGIHPALLDPEARSFAQEILLSALSGGFFGFEWISPDNYLGVEEVGGVDCFVFSDGETKAWVDSEKKQPVMWQRGDETRRFVQDKTPSSYDIPQDVLQRMRGIMQDREALRRRNT